MERYLLCEYSYACAVMEAEKFHNLPIASRRPKNAGCVFPVYIQWSENQGIWLVNPNPRAGKDNLPAQTCRWERRE